MLEGGDMEVTKIECRWCLKIIPLWPKTEGRKVLQKFKCTPAIRSNVLSKLIFASCV